MAGDAALGGFGDRYALHAVRNFESAAEDLVGEPKVVAVGAGNIKFLVTCGPAGGIGEQGLADDLFEALEKGLEDHWKMRS